VDVVHAGIKSKRSPKLGWCYCYLPLAWKPLSLDFARPDGFCGLEVPCKL
jgi:hypothetical protein